MNAPSPRPRRGGTRFTVTTGRVTHRGAHVPWSADGRPRSGPMRPDEPDDEAITPPIGAAGLDLVARILRRAERGGKRLSQQQLGFLSRIDGVVSREGERATLRVWEVRRLVRIARALGVEGAT
jgi:hypothetical protein